MASNYLDGLRIYEEGGGEWLVWVVVLFMVVLHMEDTNAWKHVSGYRYWTEPIAETIILEDRFQQGRRLERRALVFGRF